MKTYKNLLLCLFLNYALFAPSEYKFVPGEYDLEKNFSQDDCLEAFDFLYPWYSEMLKKHGYSEMVKKHVDFLSKKFQALRDRKKKPLWSFYNFINDGKIASKTKLEKYDNFFNLFSLKNNQKIKLPEVIFDPSDKLLLDIFYYEYTGSNDLPLAQKTRNKFKSILARIFTYECGGQISIKQWERFLDSFDKGFDSELCKKEFSKILNSDFNLYKFRSDEKTWISLFFKIFFESIHSKIEFNPLKENPEMYKRLNAIVDLYNQTYLYRLYSNNHSKNSKFFDCANKSKQKRNERSMPHVPNSLKKI